ncbi:DUF3848 domain-containing protein [Flavonifractor sp. An91]|uniref:DUF3848 domain-containing protein n=1 Tax=Flavonifractor sp. An91 TaxID=1965665 RepID=UPI0031BB59D6
MKQLMAGAGVAVVGTIGRIMTYGWQGNASTSWMSGNPEDASKIAGYIATQLLVWETVVGERDSQFNHVDANAQGKNNVTEYISADHPLYSEIFSQYSAIESAVKRHTMLPSFFSSTADAGAYELKWDGQQYSLTLTDENNVLGDYTFSSSTTGLNFSVDGNQLTITSAQAIKGSVTIKAEKVTAQRSGVVVWTDGVTGGGKQDFATYGETVSDSMVGYLNMEVKTGNMKLIKTSEDGQVAGINFTITGEGYSATKTTNEAGEIDITDLNPGVYTVTEQSIDKYEPQETQRVTIVSGQTATVNFNNKLKRGSLEVTKTSEDGLVEGMTFHLYGTSLSGQPVDEYAVTDGNGVARFENVLIGTGYVLEEVDTPIRYVVPDSQTATIEWNEVTHKSVNNVLKKFRVTVTKSDVETGAPQGDGSLAGAVYGLYKGDTLIDSFTTDENGQFTTGYYVCDSDWTIREISPSEGYLLDSTIHKVGAEPELYEIELNDTANDVTEQVIKGDIAIIKHTDDGETQIETPESGAEFQVFLKSAGSYENARESERDVLVCDENGFAQSKKLPYPRRGRGCACPEGCGAGTVKEDTMTNEELNTRLYEKMFAEQEQFRDWLLSQPAAEILNHAYEYTMREDILMSLEYNDLEDSQARALLKSGKPLKQIFERWENKETSHMENVWDTVQEQARAAEAKQKAKAQKER